MGFDLGAITSVFSPKGPGGQAASGGSGGAGGMASGIGAAAGTALLPGVGTLLGGKLGDMAGGLLGGGAPKTHQGDRFALTSHKLIMETLIRAKRWDDADAEERAYGAAGEMMSANEVKYGGRFLVTKHGHQDPNLPAVSVRITNGEVITFGGPPSTVPSLAPGGGTPQDTPQGPPTLAGFGFGGDALVPLIIVGGLVFVLTRGGK
jgi:hypothetical protein